MIFFGPSINLPWIVFLGILYPNRLRSLISIWNPRSDRSNNLTIFLRIHIPRLSIYIYIRLIDKKFRFYSFVQKIIHHRPSSSRQSYPTICALYSRITSCLRLFYRSKELRKDLSRNTYQNTISRHASKLASSVSFDNRAIYIEQPHEIEVNRYDLSVPMTNRSDHQWIQIGRLLRYNWLYELLCSRAKIRQSVIPRCQAQFCL